MHRILLRFGARRVLIASLGLAVLRWLLVAAYPQNLAVMIGVQSDGCRECD